MKKKLSLIGACMMVALGACAGSPPGQAAEAEDPRCAVALAYAQALIDQPGRRSVVFTGEDLDFAAPLEMARWLTSADGSSGPGRPLIAALQAQGDQSAVLRCASLRALLDARGIPYGKQAAQDVVKASDGTGYARSIESVSMPVLSEDGQSALIASSSVAGPMVASGMLHMMRKRSDGRWETVNSAPFWMS